MKIGRKRIDQVVEAILIVGFLCFVGGYAVAGGNLDPGGQSSIGGDNLSGENLSIGEDMVVNVRAPGEDTYTEVSLKAGMTVLDATASVIELKTELYSFGLAVKTADDEWLMYEVNGESPLVGMDDYQLVGGENIVLSAA